jgi:hypothetical protein
VIGRYVAQVDRRSSRRSRHPSGPRPPTPSAAPPQSRSSRPGDRRSGVFSTSARRFMISSVIGASSNQVGDCNPTLPANHRCPPRSCLLAPALWGARSRASPLRRATPSLGTRPQIIRHNGFARPGRESNALRSQWREVGESELRDFSDGHVEFRRLNLDRSWGRVIAATLISTHPSAATFAISSLSLCRVGAVLSCIDFVEISDSLSSNIRVGPNFIDGSGNTLGLTTW